MNTGAQLPLDVDPRTDLTPRPCTHNSGRDSFGPYAVQTLSTVSRIGVMGDLHGDIEHAMQAFRTFANRDVRVILQLGDWGILWPGRNWQIDLRKVSRALARNQQSMFFVDGNHDWHPKILEYPVDAAGIRWITTNIAHLPRSYRTQVGGQFTLAALGGANSLDRRLRREGVSWWPEEQISESDLRRLGSQRVHVLVGHEAPLMDEANLAATAVEMGFSADDAAYAAASRVMFRRAVSQTHPRLTLGGHYHRLIDQTITLPGPTSDQLRVVVLDMNGKGRVNLAILNTLTLGLEFLYRNGAPAEAAPDQPDTTDRTDGRTMSASEASPNAVNELLGNEGGVWRVVTRDSAHYFDLDRGTVTRVPGTDAMPSIHDQARPLRTIDTIKVGACGRWTMRTDGWSDVVDFYWHRSSEVSAILAISRADLPGASGVVPD